MRRIRDIAQLKEDLRARADIVSVIGSYFTDGLEQKGKNWWACCPFHEESTASFNVTPERGLWSCLGCRETGDLYAFVQRMHGASFPEAIEIIAEHSRFDLTPYYRELSPEEQLREDQYAVMAQVSDLFHQALLLSPQHLNFFEQRGIDRDTLAAFKIGYCPSIAWLEAQVDASVLALMEPSETQRRTLFDGHILYPQFTPGGNIWGWYARMPQGHKPKYVGPSREAPLFQGEARLYGLPQARKLLRKSELPCLIVEGFHDAMAAYQARLASVATCGTELSADQIKTLENYAIRQAITIFDGDEGGAKGMLRLAERAHEIEGTNLKFLTIPGDPDEFILGKGREAFVVACKQSVCAIEFVVQHHAHLYVPTVTGNLDFLNHIKPFLIQYPRRSISRALGVKAVAGVLDVDPLAITDFLDEHEDSPLANIRAEMIVLAEFAMNPQAWVTYPNLSPSDFLLERHARTFDLMLQCYQLSGQVNIDLLLSEAHNRRLDRSIRDTIEQLPVLERNNPDVFVQDVRDKSIRRKSRTLTQEAAREIADLRTPAAETLGNFVEGVTEILAGSSQRQVFSSVEATELAIAAFERRSESDQEIVGLNLGSDWSYLMSWLNGLRAKRQHLICAVSGVGKSLLGTNWMHRLSVAPDGPQVAGLAVSMEMDTDENIERVVSIDSGVPHFLITRSRFQSEEQANLVRASYERVRDARITWMTGHKSVAEIAMQARILQARGELDYIFIDYVQLLDVSGYNDRWSKHEKYSQASKDLLRLADDLEVPLISVAQLNREAYKEAIPSGEQMADCYDIYRDAHVCYTLAPRGKDSLLGYLDKNRGGASKKGVSLILNADPQTSNLQVKESGMVQNGPPQ